MRKLKFFLIGLIPGLVIVFFVLNKKGASCSGYLPNSRVIAETLSKEFHYSESFKTEMTSQKIDEKFLKDSIMTKGEINFEKSHAQKNLVLITFWFIQRKIRDMKSLLKNATRLPLSTH